MTTTPNELINVFIKEETPVVVFLVNGVKLQGYLTGRDHVGLALKRGTVVQAIYHSAISTVMPLEPKVDSTFVSSGGATL